MMVPGVRALCVALQWDGMQALVKQAYVMQAQMMEHTQCAQAMEHVCEAAKVPVCAVCAA